MAYAITWFLLVTTPGLRAAPFEEIIQYRQPDGTRIELWGRGDEFHAVFETLDGYSVVFNPLTKAYHYAQLSADGARLISGGTQVGQGDPAGLDLTRHLRIDPEVARREASQRRMQWEDEMQISQRWATLKAAANQVEGSTGSNSAMAPPASPTVGTRVGLCLLIDFDDDPATIPRAEVMGFCNGDNYTGYGNNGSVKEYFGDNSNNLLLYTNVVTIYIRIPNTLNPKSYYNNTARGCGPNGNYLIRDAIRVMKSLPNYTSEILPTFAALTVDGANSVLACNVLYAGGNGGVWSKGLWPHSWSLVMVGPQELSDGGKRVNRYQITNLGSSLTLGTFCHENGHLLCGFPDLYDYGMDSAGGAGRFCLMGYGGSGRSPVQVSAYLKRAAGWATITELTEQTLLTLTLTAFPQPGYNHFYRYAKPGVPSEYFLLENRNRSGRDAYLPASGIAIWHVDEYGSRDNQSLETNTTHSNYELTLVQADNLWHLQHDVNTGDVSDLYRENNPAAAYANRFNDFSRPRAHWWDGSASGIKLNHFSVAGTTMSVMAGPLVSIADTSVVEGHSGATSAAFILSLVPILPAAVTVSFETAQGTAEPNHDYIPTNGAVTFASGQTNTIVILGIIGDTNPEPAESFQLVLAPPQNALIAQPGGTCTILDDDAGPFFDDFDPVINLAQWSEFGGSVGSTVLATHYGGAVSSSNALWFGDAGTRYAITRTLDTSEGGMLDFCLRLAEGFNSNWESVELPTEGVILEYSTNGGSAWVEFGRWDTTEFTNWTRVTKPIPLPAWTKNTMFCWRQVSHGGTGNDHWALDDVRLLAAPCPAAIVSMTLESGPAILLECTGEPSASYTIETGTNLVNWIVMTNLPAGPDGLFQWETAAPMAAGARFYRLRWP